MIQKWNPRFIAYAKAHGHTPQEQLDHDDIAWSGGKMVGFMLWIRDAWIAWPKTTGEKPECGDGYSNRQHRLFDAWLKDGRP